MLRCIADAAVDWASRIPRVSRDYSSMRVRKSATGDGSSYMCILLLAGVQGENCTGLGSTL